MTTPAPIQTYVLQPSSIAGNLTLTRGGVGLRVPLPLGVCTVQVSWSGKSRILMRYRPADDIDQEHTFQVAEPTVTDTNRTGIVQLAVDKPGSVLIFQNSSGAESDLIKRLGVAIINMEMDLE